LELNFVTEKSEAIACARSWRSSRLKGGGHEKNNRKKWRAEEEERHKWSLTIKNFLINTSYLIPKHLGLQM
jgi:hypothetical protein